MFGLLAATVATPANVETAASEADSLKTGIAWVDAILEPIFNSGPALIIVIVLLLLGIGYYLYKQSKLTSQNLFELAAETLGITGEIDENTVAKAVVDTVIQFALKKLKEKQQHYVENNQKPPKLIAITYACIQSGLFNKHAVNAVAAQILAIKEKIGNKNTITVEEKPKVEEEVKEALDLEEKVEELEKEEEKL